jgi:orotate phosphoribosyltransferase
MPRGEPVARSIIKPVTQAHPILTRCGNASDQYINTNNTQSGLKISADIGKGMRDITKAKNNETLIKK